ncbi:MAG: hypothetical protein H5U19_08180 [Rhodobacteraceae bacterium]|nr:hypothetical protein [Paracoccaceae bacterium]
MTPQMPSPADAMARHFHLEDFRSAASIELSLSPPWRSGICFLPDCGHVFVPGRPWQIYCSAACERAGTAEMRKWGHRMAFAALVWRMGKYEQRDDGIRDLTRAARRYLTNVQSAWLADRQQRAADRGM